MNDKDILDYCFTDSTGKLCNKIVKNKIKNMNKEMIQYLQNRYEDSESLNESIYRLKLNINVRPVCEYCGNKVKYLQCGKYRKFCSTKCNGKNNNMVFFNKTNLKSNLLTNEIKEKTKKTLLKKYGVDNISKSNIIKEKKRKTFLEHYGYINNFFNDEIRNKAINNSKNNIDKRKETNRIKYGVDSYLSLLKGTHLSDNHKLKISKTISSKEFQENRLNTMKHNNSFIKSTFEELIYEELLKYTFKSDIIRQYVSELYPWKCDFYIKSKDVYIEAQGSQFHHFHPYDKSNDDDLNELNRMMLLKDNHPQYNSIIDTWTIKDCIKRQIAKSNKLKYIEIFPKDNFNEIIKNIFEN